MKNIDPFEKFMVGGVQTPFSNQPSAQVNLESKNIWLRSIAKLSFNINLNQVESGVKH